jgi:lipid-A-disaccharide synthase
MRVGIFAGEVSGDLLGAGLIEALRDLEPELVVEGIGGPRLAEAGCRILFPMDKLAVMGLSEVMGRYLELRSIRSRLKEKFIKDKPDIFIGVDAPDFNLGLEKKLRESGIKTIHFVSPSVWAWRAYRAKSIRESTDLMLSLFPFEGHFYQQHKIPYKFIGHPLADKIPLKSDRLSARRKLGLSEKKRIIALMPGSRENELKRMSAPFLMAARQCYEQDNDFFFTVGLVDKKAEIYFTEMKSRFAPELTVKIITGQSHTVMEAADVILLASGTVALEALLLKKPMVVAYKVSWFTSLLARLLIKIPYGSLPNLLAGRQVVPECMQRQCEPVRLKNELLKWFDDSTAVKDIQFRFESIHADLRRDANKRAAEAVLELIK